MIPYINMLPFRMLGTPAGCCWHEFIPRESVAALARGEVLAAAVPVGALPGLADCVETLGPYGIAAREESMSVLFFSDRPFDQIGSADDLRITPDSATSVRLLDLLLKRPERRPEACACEDARDPVGELIIGDRALEVMQAWRKAAAGRGASRTAAANFSHVTDLATRWHQRYNLSFVFARWVVRRDAPTDLRASLREWLERFRLQEDALVARAIPVAARRLGLSETFTARYYRCLRRVLDREDLAGQALFLDAISCRSTAVPEALPQRPGSARYPGRPRPAGRTRGAWPERPSKAVDRVGDRLLRNCPRKAS
jgi:predicted solute-binding protein